MNLQEYAPLARRTCSPLPRQLHLEHMCLGFLGEMGEIIDGYKKHIVYHKPLDLVNMGEEVGDIAWYIIGALPELGFSPDVYDRMYADATYVYVSFPQSSLREDGVPTKTVLIGCNQVLNSVATVLFLAPSTVPSECSAQAMGLLSALKSLVHTFDLDLSAVLTANIAKLAKRYGDKYSDYAALNRDLAGERAVLEERTMVVDGSLKSADVIGASDPAGAITPVIDTLPMDPPNTAVTADKLPPCQGERCLFGHNGSYIGHSEECIAEAARTQGWTPTEEDWAGAGPSAPPLPHASDCAVHNEPAQPAGPCDCDPASNG